VIDVDTADGIEYGTVILGPANDGHPDHRRIKFIDGLVSDWPVADFR
jgi:hypothetical protein